MGREGEGGDGQASSSQPRKRWARAAAEKNNAAQAEARSSAEKSSVAAAEPTVIPKEKLPSENASNVNICSPKEEKRQGNVDSASDLPYGGDLHKAMLAQDRPAIQLLMAIRD